MDSFKLSLKELTILSILIREDRYGYEMIKLAQEKGVSLALGGLYRILKGLKKKGFVDFYWGDQLEDRGGSRRKYYKITGAGERAFEYYRNSIGTIFNLGLA